MTALTIRLETSQLQDGQTIHTANLEEMPGVVAEGESEQAAVFELMALVENLRDRIDSDFVGVRTPRVLSWEWVVQHREEKPVSFKSAESDTVQGTLLAAAG